MVYIRRKIGCKTKRCMKTKIVQSRRKSGCSNLHLDINCKYIKKQLHVYSKYRMKRKISSTSRILTIKIQKAIHDKICNKMTHLLYISIFLVFEFLLNNQCIFGNRNYIWRVFILPSFLKFRASQ